MAVYLVTFKLDKPDTSPAPLISEIKKLANGWMYYIPNSILINSFEDANSIAKKLYHFISKDDYLLVIRVTNEHQGWMPDGAWKWLNERIY